MYLSAVAGIFARGLMSFAFLQNGAQISFPVRHKKKGQFGDFHHNCKQPCNEMTSQRVAFEAFDPEI